MTKDLAFSYTVAYITFRHNIPASLRGLISLLSLLHGSTAGARKDGYPLCGLPTASPEMQSGLHARTVLPYGRA